MDGPSPARLYATLVGALLVVAGIVGFFYSASFGSPGEVDDVFGWAMARDGTAIREPQEFPQYHEGYYAAFWQDPHGFLLEVVCHRDHSVE